jgi:hypothetical protein
MIFMSALGSRARQSQYGPSDARPGPRAGVGRNWITADLERPLGRGINFQISVPSVAPLNVRVTIAASPRTGDVNTAHARRGGAGERVSAERVLRKIRSSPKTADKLIAAVQTLMIASVRSGRQRLDVA